MGWVGAGDPLLFAGVDNVSIPERVWGGLERELHNWVVPMGLFQSLRGFGVGWSVFVIGIAPSVGRFQSLRGFGVGWSRRTP